MEYIILAIVLYLFMGVMMALGSKSRGVFADAIFILGWLYYYIKEINN